jgi:hypothetical protein
LKGEWRDVRRSDDAPSAVRSGPWPQASTRRCRPEPYLVVDRMNRVRLGGLYPVSVSQPSRARLECVVGVGLAGLVLIVGVVMPSPWFRLLIVAGAAWAAIALGVIMATSDWNAKSSGARRRLVWASHCCGLLPLLLAIGTEGATVGSGMPVDPQDFGDPE